MFWILGILFRVGGAMFFAAIVSYLVVRAGLAEVVLYQGDSVYLTLWFAAVAFTFVGSFLTFVVKI